ncbi:hypothetical protein HYU06_00030 [Candidatus Woesearchaeota archaeon]|nr:hypothetical protein [Candidatus Woesearchaeota archaeon]
MVKVFLATRPKHDVITSYLYAFSEEIIKAVKGMDNIHLANLEGESATRFNLEQSLVKDKPKLIFLNGHGDKKRVAGHKDEVILDENNIHLSKDKIVYAIACDSLEELGEIAVEKGAKAYIGYRAKFMLVVDPSRTTSPNKDNNALPFKKACTTLINSLIFGEKVNAAVERTKSEYRQLIRSLGTSEDDPYGDVPLVRFALAWNLEFLGVCGDGEESF